MKVIGLCMLVLAYLISSCSQDISTANVPSVVRNTVPSKFPGARGVEWEKEKDYYEAEFKIDRVGHSLHIDGSGKVLLHKKDMPASALPAPVISVIQKKFPEYKIDEAEMIDQGGSTIYEIELKARNKKGLKIFLTAEGETGKLK